MTYSHLTRAQRDRAILTLSLPIIGGMISQNILNLVDTAMVGQLGVHALASVGLGSFLNFLCCAFLMGLAVGVQTICAQWRGAKRLEYAVPLNGGLLLSIVVGIPLSLFLIWFTPSLMSWVSDDLSIQQEGGVYLQARLLGMVAVGINFTFRSYWSAIERTQIYLFTLIMMHSLNILLNWILIFGKLGVEPMGVEGAGLGTALSLWAGVIMYFIFALKHSIKHGFLQSLPDLKTWKTLLSMSIPSGVERTFFALGMTFFMTIIGWIGAAELATSNVILNLFLVAILPAMGFGISSATFIARSIGEETPQEAELWKSAVSRWAVGVLTLLEVIFLMIPEWICSVFIQEAQPLEMATTTLRLMGIFLPIEAMHMVTYQSLLGLGDNRYVMMVSLSAQWGLMLPLIYLLGFQLGWGVTWVWGIHFIGRVVVFGMYQWRWSQKMSAL